MLNKPPGDGSILLKTLNEFLNALKDFLGIFNISKWPVLHQKDILIIILIPFFIAALYGFKAIDNKAATNGFYVWIGITAFRVILHPYFNKKANSKK